MNALAAALAALLFSTTPRARPAAGPDLVDVRALVPSAVLDLRYATERNFTGQALYPAGAVIGSSGLVSGSANDLCDVNTMEDRGNPMTRFVQGCSAPDPSVPTNPAHRYHSLPVRLLLARMPAANLTHL